MAAAAAGTMTSYDVARNICQALDDGDGGDDDDGIRARQLAARDEFLALLSPSGHGHPPGTMPSVVAARAILDAIERRRGRS